MHAAAFRSAALVAELLASLDASIRNLWSLHRTRKENGAKQCVKKLDMVCAFVFIQNFNLAHCKFNNRELAGQPGGERT